MRCSSPSARSACDRRCRVRLVACVGDDPAWRLMAWGGHCLPVLTLAAALRRTRDAQVRAAVDAGESCRRVGVCFGVSAARVAQIARRG